MRRREPERVGGDGSDSDNDPIEIVGGGANTGGDATGGGAAAGRGTDADPNGGTLGGARGGALGGALGGAAAAAASPLGRVPLGADEKYAVLMARHPRLGARAPRALRTMGDYLLVGIFGWLHEPRRVVTKPDGLKFFWEFGTWQ